MLKYVKDLLSTLLVDMVIDVVTGETEEILFCKIMYANDY